MAGHLQEIARRRGGSDPASIGIGETARAAAELAGRFDAANGGFGGCAEVSARRDALALLLTSTSR